jgi:probable rRNA maturation factor
MRGPVKILGTTERGAFARAAAMARSALRVACRSRRLAGVAVELHIVSDETMAQLRWQSLRKRGPASVLSFPAERGYPYPPGGKTAPRYLGEIYLAPRYARRKGYSLARLAVHGLLHLCGYTHDAAHDSMNMEAEERRLLSGG